MPEPLIRLTNISTSRNANRITPSCVWIRQRWLTHYESNFKAVIAAAHQRRLPTVFHTTIRDGVPKVETSFRVSGRRPDPLPFINV
jgi:hypothetical protein